MNYNKWIFFKYIIKKKKKKRKLLWDSKVHRLKCNLKIEPSGQLLKEDEKLLHSIVLSDPLLRLYVKWYWPVIGQYSFLIGTFPISLVPIQTMNHVN